jgi:histidyl-tRNA synthetase
MLFSKNKKIKNIKSLPGFLELNPADQILFNDIKKNISDIYEKYGFTPLDNATIERSEILFAKAGGDTEKEIYRIKKGDNDLALRFDLTVPLSRYVAANYNEITFPFRRYQIEKVFRGERPQKGRFREFYQCDIDIVGDGILDLKNDAEIASIIYSVFSKLNIGPFVIKINNRKILTGFMESLDLKKQSEEILRIIDKLEKIGKEKVEKLLKDLKIDDDKIKQIFELILIEGSDKEILVKLSNLNIDNVEFQDGVSELNQVVDFLDLFNIPNDYYKIDLKTVRGLDYYTGTVYETFSVDYPEFGSICSGGRYENLSEYYTDKKLPGVGVSIGLTRLFSQLKKSGALDSNVKSVADLLILPVTDKMEVPVRIANDLRRQNVKTEIYLEDKPIKKKFNYADKKGFEYVLIIGDDEINKREYTLKNMKNGEQKTVPEKEIVGLIRSLDYKKS